MTRDLDSQNDVDVLLPIYYSQERFLIKSINSLISQTLRPKIICILNGMDFKYNKYYKELLNDLKVDKILLSPKKGIPNALNYAVQFCEANYIARQDDDDISHPERIFKQKELLNKKNIDVLGCNINLINEYGQTVGARKYPLTDKECKLTLAYKTCFCHPSVMFKKSFLLKNKYPIVSGEDYALWLKSYENSIFSNIDNQLYYYRIHSRQISKTNINYLFFQESKKVIKKLEKKRERYFAAFNLILIIINCLVKKRKIDFKTHLT